MRKTFEKVSRFLSATASPTPSPPEGQTSNFLTSKFSRPFFEFRRQNLDTKSDMVGTAPSRGPRTLITPMTPRVTNLTVDAEQDKHEEEQDAPQPRRLHPVQRVRIRDECQRRAFFRELAH